MIFFYILKMSFRCAIPARCSGEVHHTLDMTEESAQESELLGGYFLVFWAIPVTLAFDPVILTSNVNFDHERKVLDTTYQIASSYFKTLNLNEVLVTLSMFEIVRWSPLTSKVNFDPEWKVFPQSSIITPMRVLLQNPEFL